MMNERPRKYKLHLTGGGLFHDTRKDVILLAKIVNMQHDKINELIKEINELKNNLNKDL